MQNSDMPTKLPIPFAIAAGGGFIHAIPVNSQIGIVDGAASLHDGFVPLNATPVGAGGVPPSIQDMNGILYEISAWTRWTTAGGPVYYDAAFNGVIGGYPKGAILHSAVTAGKLYISSTENNGDDPDSGSSQWSVLMPVKASAAEVIAGTDDAKFLTPLAFYGARASAAEILSGLSQHKYLTPFEFAAAFAAMDVATGSDIPTGNTGFHISLNVQGIPAPLIIQGGKVVDGSNVNVLCNYVVPFTTVVLCCGGDPYTDGTGGSDADWFTGIYGTPGLTSLFYSVSRNGGDKHAAGVYWWAIGY